MIWIFLTKAFHICNFYSSIMHHFYKKILRSSLSLTDSADYIIFNLSNLLVNKLMLLYINFFGQSFGRSLWRTFTGLGLSAYFDLGDVVVRQLVRGGCFIFCIQIIWLFVMLAGLWFIIWIICNLLVIAFADVCFHFRSCHISV